MNYIYIWGNKSVDYSFHFHVRVNFSIKKAENVEDDTADQQAHACAPGS